MREGCLPRGNSGVSLRLESVNDGDDLHAL